ncbi:MAG: glycerate kinase [Propionibacteriaceae bacterium]
MTEAAAGYVVVAPDKFKGSLSGAEVAAALRNGVRRGAPEVEVRLAPVADGGEGTVEAALFSGFTAQNVTVRGPLGEDVDAVLAIRDETAVVEMALASGLQLVPRDRLEPLRATSYGTGELVRAAPDAGCRTVILGIGGSAGTDGGAGLVQALGARLLDAHGRELALGGGPLADLALLDLSGLDPRIAETTFVIASDVDNPLLGAAGAAAVFGPQKGADAAQVRQLDAALSHWAAVVTETVGKDYAVEPGAGAAGGVGFAAMAVLSATSRPGIQLLLEMTGFAQLLEGARLVITGEGSLDEQSLGGKAPIGVASAAAALGIPTLAVAGVTKLAPDTLIHAGFAATYTLQGVEPDLARCMSEAAELLDRIGQQIAADWLGDTPTRGEAP